MNIIIAGDGKVGSALARQLSSEGYDITVIDTNLRVLEDSSERYDVFTVQGNCASMDTLLEAGVRDADLLIAATNADEVNLLCCAIAHGINPKLHTIARIRNPEYDEQIFQMRDIFGLSMSINPERRAAREIERLIKLPGFLRREVFAKGRTEIVELKIDKTSKLLNAKLMELHAIIKCRVLICAVLRDGKAMVPNSGLFTFQEGDRVFVTAPTKNLSLLLKNLNIITRRVRSVLICGAGNVCYYLASSLLKSGMSVKIVERSEARCNEIKTLLPEAEVILGDAADPELLESENLRNYDALVTLTGEDELNMIVSLYAENAGLPLVITKLGKASNRNILDTLNLGSVVCPKDLVVSNIVRYVRAMQNQTGAAVSVHSIADGQVEAMEFVVDKNNKHCDIPLKNLKPKPNVLIASITHGAWTEIPNGDSMFHKGDSVVVVVTRGDTQVRQLNDIFE
ncbi:MAG: Trk system potassium transporter TrkA [Ruminococcaceae bacterium]|nr:Trk system potassium transporter TrkA [Oscillospiraceae bacterium]